MVVAPMTSRAPAFSDVPPSVFASSPTAPGDAHIRLDIADAHPLRLGWKSTSPNRGDDIPVEVTALLAPRQLPTRDEGDVE